VFDLVCQNFHQNIDTGLQYGYFLLNQKDLDSKTILPKIFCNMHIAHCNMHIAIESILPLTYVPYGMEVNSYVSLDSRIAVLFRHVSSGYELSLSYICR
jgi:hypothetical protein